MQAIPFTVRRTVKWGECDPANIVYTPQFLHWAVEAAESFYSAILGLTWNENQTQRKLGSPMAQANLTFISPLKSGDVFDLVVKLDKVGRSSLTYRVTGQSPEGKPHFVSTLTAVFVSLESYRSHEMPADYREKLEAYREACLAKERAA